MHFPVRFQFVAFLVLCTLVQAGCSKQDPLNRQAVSGQILLKGTPLETGSIEFHPLKGSGTMSGAVIEAGQYSIDKDRGLPPGDYVVRIYSADEEADAQEMPGESNKLAVEKIPSEFNTDSKEMIIVKAGDPNRFDFQIP